MFDIPSTLATNLKFLREKAGLTQDELSDRAGVAYSTVAKLEQGAIKNPTLTTIWSISQVLSVSVDELLSEMKHSAKDHSKKIKFIYFDVNGVLVRFYHRAFSVIAQETGQPIDKIESIFWHYNSAANRGDISMAEFNQYMGEKLGVKDLCFEDYYVQEAEAITASRKLLSKLSKKYKIGLLTNNFPTAVGKLQKAGKLPKVKEGLLIDSSVVGTVKPEAKIFDIAEEKAGVKAGEILLIDDNRENLVAAEEKGWHVNWFDAFKPEESVKRILEVLGED